MSLSSRIWLAILCLAFGKTSTASQITWGLAAFSDHRTGKGTPLPAGTRIQLGVFTNGFAPSPSNQASWVEHWHPRAEILYDAFYRGASSSLVIEENEVPFSDGTPFYLFVFRQTSDFESEWLLATDPDWVLPELDPLAFPIDCELALARTTILGQIDRDRLSIATTTVATGSVPVFPYAAWQAQWFFLVERRSSDIARIFADPDGDGEPNAWEYLTGQNPRLSTSGGSLGILKDAGSITVSWPASPTATLLPPTLQQTSDLIQWQSVTATQSYHIGLQRWSAQLPVTQAGAFWRLSWNSR